MLLMMGEVLRLADVATVVPEQHDSGDGWLKPIACGVGGHEPARYDSAGIYVSCRSCTALLGPEPHAQGRELPADAVPHDVAGACC